MSADPSADAPVLNTMLEDYLARGGTEEQDCALLQAWLMLGAERLARTGGRSRALRLLESLARFVRDAQPSTPWKP